MPVGFASHGQRLVADFVLDRSPSGHLQRVRTAEVSAFNDRLEVPVHGGLVRHRYTLCFLGPDRSHDGGHGRGRRDLGAGASKG